MDRCVFPMHVTCPACSARYSTDEHKIRGKTARMRCRSCGTVWLVSGPLADARAEEPRANVVRRGAEREKRDLFAPRPLDTGAVRQTLRPGPPASDDDTNPPARRGGHVAERNESSVLFTLAGLTGAARLKTPQPEQAPMTETPQDDEGIIDLHALASTPPKAFGRAPVMPLFSEPPPAAFSRDADPSAEYAAQPAAARSRKPLFGVIAAAVAVVFVGAGVAFAFRGEEPKPVAAVAPPAPPPPAVVATPAPAPEPAPVVASAPEETKAPATTSSGKKGKPGKGGKAGKAGASAATAKASKAEAAPKPAASKPAADPCGCKGDFNCVLACTVKKGK